MKLRTDDVVWQEIEDEIVVLDLRTSTYFRLNGSGAVLWRLLADSATRGELLSAITDTYAIDEEQAAADIDDFIAELESWQFLFGAS